MDAAGLSSYMYQLSVFQRTWLSGSELRQTRHSVWLLGAKMPELQTTAFRSHSPLSSWACRPSCGWRPRWG